MARTVPLKITASDEHELRQMVRSHRVSAAQAQRARISLALAAGKTYEAISEELECDPSQATGWVDALEHAQARSASGHQPHDGRACLGQASPQAAPDRALHGVQRSAF